MLNIFVLKYFFVKKQYFPRKLPNCFGSAFDHFLGCRGKNWHVDLDKWFNRITTSILNWSNFANLTTKLISSEMNDKSSDNNTYDNKLHAKGTIYA